MRILSIEFLCFVALMILVYYILPQKYRYLSLLGFSVTFIMISGWQGGLCLLTIGIITWLGALGLQYLRQAEKSRVHEKGARKPVRFSRLLLCLLLVMELGVMAYVKYYADLAGWLNSTWLTQSPLPIGQIIVPLGLSYFTFQSVGYLIDVYWSKAKASKNPLRTLLFLFYFLYLPQGPISSWRELESPLTRGNLLDPVQFVSGFQLMVWGFFKKLVIADRLALINDYVLSAKPKMPGWLAMGSTIVYVIRLYADFSGGIDVVRGVSRMVGVELPENFRRPFFATSIADYWRRWHITLGAWFRTYLLYPLATCRFGIFLGKMFSKVMGKKTGLMMPTALTTVLIFFLIGIWHTANLNAIYFGLYFGTIMALSMLLEPLWKWLRKKLHLPKGSWMKPFRIVRTWLLVLLPQFFAYTPSVDKALNLLNRAFTFREWDFTNFSIYCRIMMPELEWWILGGAFLLMLIVDIAAEKKKDLGTRLARTPIYIRWPILILLIMIVLFFGYYGTDFSASDFVYIQF